MASKEQVFRGIAWATLVVGVVASVVSEVVHVRSYLDPEVSSFCTVGSRFDCTTISLSRFAVVGGVPLPLWGLAGFLAMALALWRRSQLFLVLAGGASVASLYLLYVELRVVHTVCLVCEAVHLASWIAFAVAVPLFAKSREVTPRDAAKTLVPSALLVAVAWAVVPEYWGVVAWDEPLPYPHGFDADGRSWVGAEKPAVVIHEYLHYGCPHCKVAMARTRRWLLTRGDKVRFVRHHQPLSRCPAGSAHCQLLRLALCAEKQGMFWEADAWLFGNATGYKWIEADYFARAIGLDAAALDACIESKETYARADAEAKAAFDMGRTGTPGYYVDGKELLLPEIEELLERL